jgi:hypothetical protein
MASSSVEASRPGRSGPTVYLKQYGARRTGTNCLKLMIERNLRDAVVLMHVLGDKHSPPVDLELLARRALADDDPAGSFVRSATSAAPSQTNDDADVGQSAFLSEIAPSLWEAAAAGRLGCVASIRDPHDWAFSILRWGDAAHAVLGTRWPSRAARLAQELESFNRLYRALFDCRFFGDRFLLVKAEDLVARPIAVLRDLESRFGLARAVGAAGRIEETVLPTHWDNRATGLSSSPYARIIPRRGRHFDEVVSIVDETIDWDFFSELGYRPRATSRA